MIRSTLALSLALMAMPALAAPEDAFGTWLTENQRAIVEISPCGDRACGAIVWTLKKTNDNGSTLSDVNNPDPALQSRTVCGLPMIGDFTRDGNGRWENGFIYDPQSGKTYKSKMHVKDDGTLYVRGYVGTPLLGKSQIWTRVSDIRGGC